LIIDRRALDEDELTPVHPIHLLFARASRSHLRKMIVADRGILHQGKIIGIEMDAVQKELRIAYRAAMPSRADFLNAWPGFGAAICAHYQKRLGCC
jgi:hypothetical protein